MFLSSYGCSEPGLQGQVFLVRAIPDSQGTEKEVQDPSLLTWWVPAEFVS